METPDVPRVTGKLLSDEHRDERMPKVFETNGAVIVVIVKAPKNYDKDEQSADVDVAVHIEDSIPPAVASALLHNIADTIALSPG